MKFKCSYKSLECRKQLKLAFLVSFLFYTSYALFNYYQDYKKIDLASQHLNNADAAFKGGDYVLAQNEYISALAIYNIHDKRFSPVVISAKNNLALAYKAQGKMEESRDTFVSAVDGIQKITNENEDEVGIVMVNLANLLLEHGSADEAKNLLLTSLKLIDPNSSYYHQVNAALSKIEGK